ncbi:hypothetical protein ACM614_29050 [Streptomyces sp. 12297]
MGRMNGWRVGLMAAVCAVLAGCNAAAYHAVSLDTAELAGQWRSREGTTLTFQEDGTFTGREVARLSAARSCGDLSRTTSGTWHFGSEFEPADHGPVLYFTPSGTNCQVFVILFGDADDPAMCPTDGDPDQGCEYDEYLHRTVPAAAVRRL